MKQGVVQILCNPPHGLHRASGLVSAEAMKLAQPHNSKDPVLSCLSHKAFAVGMWTHCCCHGCYTTADVTVSKTMDCEVQDHGL